MEVPKASFLRERKEWMSLAIPYTTRHSTKRLKTGRLLPLKELRKTRINQLKPGISLFSSTTSLRLSELPKTPLGPTSRLTSSYDRWTRQKIDSFEYEQNYRVTTRRSEREVGIGEVVGRKIKAKPETNVVISIASKLPQRSTPLSLHHPKPQFHRLQSHPRYLPSPHLSIINFQYTGGDLSPKSAVIKSN